MVRPTLCITEKQAGRPSSPNHGRKTAAPTLKVSFHSKPFSAYSSRGLATGWRRSRNDDAAVHESK